MAKEFSHGANLETTGGQRRLSKDQAQKRDMEKKKPVDRLLVSGAVIGAIGVAMGLFGLPLVFVGIGFFGVYVAKNMRKEREKAAKGYPSDTGFRELEKKEEQRKADQRKKEKASYQASATYREHYGHREAPQAPIDWDLYRENLGPSKEKRRQQTQQLYEAGLLDREEYREKLREIENS